MHNKCHHTLCIGLEVRDVVPGADMVSISVGKNSITLPNVELTNSLGRSSGMYPACKHLDT